MTLLSVRNLSLSIGRHPILSDVSFDIGEGQIFGLVGESGSGKSMTALAVMQLLPDLARCCGAVRLDGTDLLAATEPELCAIRGRSVGMVFQEPRLLPWFSTLRNIEIVGTTGERAAALLDQVGLPAAASLYPRQLSLGMARRVVLARALAIEPELLILDEPFASLDPTAADGLRRLVKDLCEQGNVTALLVSHDSGDVAAIADRALILYGRPARLMRDVSFDVAPEQRSAGDLAAITNQLRSILASANESGTESFNSPDVSPN